MNATVIFRLLGLLLICHATVLAQQQTWTKAQIPNLSTTVDKLSPTLVIDPSHTIHIGFATNTTWNTSYGGASSTLNYIARTTWPSVSWGMPQTVDQNGIHHAMAVALDSSNGLHFLYSKSSNTLTHRSLSSGSFSTATSIGTGWYPALAADPTGQLHAAYDIPSSPPRYRLRSTTGAWSNPYQYISSGSGRSASIAVDRSNGVHIIFAVDNSGSNYTIYYTRDSASTFKYPVAIASNIPTIPGGVGTTIFGISVATDRNNAAHVVFTKVISSSPKTRFCLITD